MSYRALIPQSVALGIVALILCGVVSLRFRIDQRAMYFPLGRSRAGAVVGSAYNDTGYGAAYGAAMGTTTGAVRGASEGIQRHDNIVSECMRGRGYTVLD